MLEELVAFLRHVLPDKGYYCGVALPPAGGKPNQRFFKTPEELAKFLLAMAKQGWNAYYAVSTFKDVTSRKADNVLTRKCLPMDIDTRERLDGKPAPYADQMEAYNAVIVFCNAVNLVAPTIVGSGYGLQPLFVLDQAVLGHELEPYLVGLRGACHRHSLHIDAARTVDLASILRPPYTYNFKYGQLRHVEVSRLEPPQPLSSFSHLLEYVTHDTVKRSGKSKAARGDRARSPVAAAAANLGTDRHAMLGIAAAHCGQLAKLRERGKEFGEPHWHAVCGNAAYCRDGRELLCQWADGYDGHPRAGTDQWILNKCDTWEKSASGPTTCKHWQAIDPEVCATCQYKGQITTPLELSRIVQTITEPPQAGPSFPVASGEKKSLPKLKFNRDNIPTSSWHNTREVMRHMGMRFRLNMFNQEIRFSWPGNQRFEIEAPIEDHLIQYIRALIYDRYQFEPSQNMATDACIQLATENRYHPVREYLNSLVWSGQRGKIDTWLTDHLGVEDCELTRNFARLTLMAAVMRVFDPGCKYDQMLIVEGRQGIGKTSTFVTLSNGWYYGGPMLNLPYQRQVEHMMGAWIIEIQELAGFRKTSMEMFNAFCSLQSDKTRLAYGRLPVQLPRQCIFTATTNDHNYLKGFNGNRRAWSVLAGVVPFQLMTRAQADNLWAETVAEVRSTANSLILPKKLWGAAALVQDNRRAIDPWEDELENLEGTHLEGTEERIASAWLMRRLGVTPDRSTDAHFKRLSEIMRFKGWEGPVVKRIAGVPARCYYRQVSEEEADRRKGNVIPLLRRP